MDGHRGQRQAPRARPCDRDHREAPRGIALSEAKSREAADVTERSEGGVGLSEAKSREAADVTERSEGGVGLSEGNEPDKEELPFDVHVERFPTWGLVMSALTIVVAVAVTLGRVSSFFLVIPFIASTAARRFGATPMNASIDKDGLWLGDTLVAPRADVLDAWADPDDTDHRVSVAVKSDQLLVIHLPNREQARRFASELSPPNDDRAVAGFRPRAIDAVYPVRLLAVIASFIVSTGWKNPGAALVLVFFAIGAYGFVVGAQIQSGPDGLTLKRFARERHLPWSDVTDDLLDELPPRIVRSPLLATSPWTKHAHARVIAHAKSEMKKRREG